MHRARSGSGAEERVITQLFGVMFGVGTGIYNNHWIVSFFGLASVVAFMAWGRGVCAWFGSFLLKAVLTPCQ